MTTNTFKSMLSMIVFVLIMLSTKTHAETKTITLGYCSNEITLNSERINLEYDCPIQAAIRYTASQMAAYKGGKITKIRIGAESGMTSTWCWIRPSLNQGAVTMKRLGTTEDGWNEVTLDKPYEIDGSEIYIGFNCTLPQGKDLIYQGPETSEERSYLYAEGIGWETFYDGALLIQAVVEIDGDINTDDMGIESLQLGSKFSKNDNEQIVTVKVANYSDTEKPFPTLHLQLADMEELTLDTDEMIPSNSSKKVYKMFTPKGLSDGKHSLRIWFEEDDAVKENNTAETDVFIYSEAFNRNVLLEHFTTLSCTNCPTGDKILRKAVNGNENVAWVAHHVGFGTDELTVTPSESIMLDLLYTEVAPMASFDRTVNSLSEGNHPAFGIAYNSINDGVTMIKALLNNALNEPAFATVCPKVSYDQSSRTINVEVTGERNTNMYEAIYNTGCNLTVYLTEDNVVTKAYQTGGTPADTIHSHVLRKALSADYGDAVEWTGNTFSKNYTYTLPENWKPTDMKVIAFLNRPVKGAKATDIEVLNTGIASITETTDIKDATTVDGISTEYFSLDGQRTNASLLQKGTVYIKRIKTSNGVVCKKFIKQ